MPRLVESTEREQADLLRIPFVDAAMRGELTRPQYVAFLTQAYHHVKHTVPLLMAAGSRIPSTHEWLRDAIVEYVDEEHGHERWILDDIAACGGDADMVRRGRPELPCELMVAYAYDQIMRVDPLGFFGMVHVLEGTSVKGATRAADALAASLRLPKSAFSYLSSHGSLDIEHVNFFAGLMDGIVDPREQEVVLHAARVFFRLYGDVFRGLEPKSARPGVAA
jgi:heme oxygenase